MRSAFLPALAVACLAAAPRADEPALSYDSTDTLVVRTGGKVSGHIGACQVGQGKRPRLCFGLDKEAGGDPQFTFLVLFRTGKKDCNPTGSEGQINSDGAVTKFKEVYHLGAFKMPLTLETKSDPKTGKVSSRKVTVGDVEVPDKGSGVVVVDLTGEKPAYKFVKVELPACKVDLVDKERKTWPGAIDEAIAELKKKSKELAMLAD